MLKVYENAMFIAGVVTLIQLFSIGPVGGKVPIIMGTSSGFIGVFNSVAATMGGGVIDGEMGNEMAEFMNMMRLSDMLKMGGDKIGSEVKLALNEALNKIKK